MNNRLANYIKQMNPPVRYKDRCFEGTEDQYFECLLKSTTLWVGNINPIVKEECLWELFSLCGNVKRVIMGVNRNDMRPCGFCFVEFYIRSDAENAFTFLNGLEYEDMVIKCNFDHGYSPGREFGRGQRGGQLRDDFKRVKLDDNRFKGSFKKRYHRKNG